MKKIKHQKTIQGFQGLFVGDIFCSDLQWYFHEDVCLSDAEKRRSLRHMKAHAALITFW